MTAEPLSISDILNLDLQKNHAGRNISFNTALQILDQYVKSGGKLYRIQNTLFIAKRISNSDVEAHLISGESGKRLRDNMHSFADQLKAEGIKFVTMYYDNPKVTTLCQQVKPNVQTVRVNQGLDRTFRSKVSL